MPSRYRLRQRALQILFEWDIRRNPVSQAIEHYYETLYSEEYEQTPEREAFAEGLITGTVDNIEEIDELISSHAENWRMSRMPAVDRNVLRMATYEMMKLGTPPPVVIDQAIELARRFSGEDSVHFINGVLDAVRRGLEQQGRLAAQSPPPRTNPPPQS